MNNPANKPSTSQFAAWMAIARWIIAALFIWMGINKAIEPVDFLKLLRQYDLAHTPWMLNLVAATLPWFEIFCGVLLGLGVAVRGVALVVLAMLGPFTWLVLQRALALQAASGSPFCSIRFDCGCGAGEVWICAKLLENLLLIAVCALLVMVREGRFCMRFNLFN